MKKLSGMYSVLVSGKTIVANRTYLEAVAKQETLLHHNSAVTIQRQK